MAANEVEGEVPALFEHCTFAYNVMLEQGEPYGEGLYKWEGSLTNLFEEIGLGISRYTRVTRVLQKMGCIEQKHRGGGPVPSEWILVKEPDMETFEWAKRKLKYEEGQADPMEQRISDINRRLSDLEDHVYADSQT